MLKTILATHCDRAIAKTPILVLFQSSFMVIRSPSSIEGPLTPDNKIGIAAILIIKDIKMKRSILNGSAIVSKNCPIHIPKRRVVAYIDNICPLSEFDDALFNQLSETT